MKQLVRARDRVTHRWASKGNGKLQQGFREAEVQKGVRLIGVDTYLMSLVEVAYQLRVVGGRVVKL
ncbi:MAG TPA: hypothetical protein DCY88_32035 [Cyanobacteria bacterium UBA11372]|nr:hypothetical protein [Cyanobacteria bacterium UBA11372]